MFLSIVSVDGYRHHRCRLAICLASLVFLGASPVVADETSETNAGSSGSSGSSGRVSMCCAKPTLSN